MRQNYRITVTDCHRARHYTLTQLMRRIALAAGGLVASTFLGCILVIFALSGHIGSLDARLAELKAQKSSVQEENRQLLARQSALDEQVETRAAELIALTDDLEQLEELVGVEPPPSLPVSARIEVASLTAFEKRLMLNSIPSGSPIESARVTSRYGMRQHPLIERTRLHGGVDFSASIGTPVSVTADGVVEFAGDNPGSGMGRMIKVVHNYGFSTIYAHLSEVEVEVGQYVTQGEAIGQTGNTGLSSAPHLHYEVRYLERRLDPKSFMDWSFERYRTVFEQEERVQWQSLARTVRNKVRTMDQPSSPPAQGLSATSASATISTSTAE